MTGSDSCLDSQDALLLHPPEFHRALYKVFSTISTLINLNSYQSHLLIFLPDLWSHDHPCSPAMRSLLSLFSHCGCPATLSPDGSQSSGSRPLQFQPSPTSARPTANTRSDSNCATVEHERTWKSMEEHGRTWKNIHVTMLHVCLSVTYVTYLSDIVRWSTTRRFHIWLRSGRSGSS